MKIVITYGTFDLLHYGHIRYLQRAKSYGDYLIVGLSTDQFNEKGKGKKAYYPYHIREEMLSAIKYVDKVIPQDSFEQKIQDIIENNVAICVSSEEYEGKYDYLREYCDVIYLSRTREISTTKIKKDLNMKEFVKN